MKSVLSLFAAVILTLGVAPPAAAQSYPHKLVRFIVSVFPGSPIDVLARLLGPKLSESLGQPVLVENRGGAGGTIGMAQLAKMPPDGYTIGMMPMPVTVAHSIYPLQYDTLRDFVPVVQLVWQYNILVVNPSLPVNSVAELVALLKANPGKYLYASGGNGTPAHLSGEFFKIFAEINMAHVPYKTLTPALLDVIAGRVPIIFAASAPTIPHITSGKLRALGVTGPARMAPLPDVPTIAESGLAGFQVGDWQGVVAPAATPAEIVTRLGGELQRIQSTADFRDLLVKFGMDPVAPHTPAEFAALVKSDVERWARAVAASGTRVD